MHPRFADSTALAATLVRWLAVFLLAAGLCNGAVPWLKRIGWMDAAAYGEYWAIHCSEDTGLAAREWQCAAYTTPGRIAQRAREGERDLFGWEHIWSVATPLERSLKLVKEALWVAVVIAGAWLARKSWLEGTRWRAPPALVPLLACAAAALAFTVWLNGWVMAMAGLRFFQFLVVVALGPPLLATMGGWCAGAAALIAAQVAFLPPELVLGMHISHEWGPSLALRPAGTMVQPNSLGVFLVTGLAFIHSFAGSRSWSRRIWPLAAALALASGTATAMAGLVVLAACSVPGLLRARNWRRETVTVLLAALVLGGGLALIALRPSALVSAVSRAETFAAAVHGHPWLDVLVGRGLGVNTNFALTLDPRSGVPADSMVTALLVQVGIAGLALFYGTWAWLARRDPRAWPFHAVAMVCSLTFNITELFPLNLLLGMAWSHALWAGTPPATAASRAS